MLGIGKAIQHSFKRYEKKYIVTQAEKDKLIQLIDGKLTPDTYPEYSIYNIYYDTENFDLIRRSIEKPLYKEKLRLRSYGPPKETDPVFIEIKKKFNGIVYKRRINLPYDEALLYLNNDMPIKDKGQIFNEIDYAINFYKPQPKVFLSYDRRAFFGAEYGNLRLTFDYNILARDYDVDLQKGAYGTSLLEQGLYLMELKISGAVPLWLARVLSDMQLYPTSFSKYGNFYIQMLKKQDGPKIYALK